MSSSIEQPIKWFHSIDLGHEITSGVKSHDLLNQEAGVIFSYPVSGKTFLDIGAWDGFFYFQAESRGAARVTATDRFCWGGGGWGTQDGFNHARRHLNSRVEDVEVDVPDISPDNVGIHDIALLSGVLYHVRDPFSILETVSRVVGECLIVETAVALVTVREPTMLYLRGMEYNIDSTNYWAPNPSCVTAMLKDCGFRTVLTAAHPTNPLEHPTNPR